MHRLSSNCRRSADLRFLALLCLSVWLAPAALLTGCGGGNADSTDTQAALPNVTLPQLQCQQRREQCA